MLDSVAWSFQSSLCDRVREKGKGPPCSSNIVGQSPVIAETAVIAPTAVISGDVEIGPDTVVLAGAVITSEGAPVRIGGSCVVMEHAVIRGAGRHPATIGDYVLLGPHTHVSGATIDDRVFIATGASIFNGAVVGQGSVVAINGVVHIETKCPAGTLVPIGHVAVGDPARIVSPADAPEIHAELGRLGFSQRVFGLEADSLVDPATIEELCRRYSRGLAGHRDDVIVPNRESGGIVNGS